jgi:hypothetical protein
MSGPHTQFQAFPGYGKRPAGMLPHSPQLSPIKIRSTPAPTRSMNSGPTVPEGDLILALVALVLGNRSEVARG